MGTGYVRNDTANNIADGNVINASDLDGEFDAIQSAFNASTGHSHDGTTGEGPQINTAGLADDSVTPAKLDSTLNYTVNGLTATSITFGGTSLTPTAAEINILDGDTSATATTLVGADRLVVNDAGSMKQVALTDLTTYLEGSMDTLNGLTSSITELNYNDITTLGTVQASKVVTADASGNINFNSGDMTNVDINSGTIDGTNIGVSSAGTGNFSTLSIGGTAITSTATELNFVDGVTSNIQTQLDAKGTGTVSTLSDLGINATAAELNKLDNVTSSTAEFNILDGDTAATSTTLVNADRVVVNDAGVMKQVAMSDVLVYTNAGASITESQISNLGTTVVLDSDIGSTVQAYDADTAKTDVAQTFTASQRGTVTADNDGSFDLNASNYFTCTPTGAIDLAFTNETTGQTGTILLVNTTPQVVTVSPDVFLSAADLTTINVAGTYLLSYFCPDGINVYLSATPAQVEGS